MSTSSTSASRMVLLTAVRGLARDARSARAHLGPHDAEREFYLGVEAATDTILRPAFADARPAGWLDRESDAFREGYLATTADLAMIETGDHVPIHLPLPRMARGEEP